MADEARRRLKTLIPAEERDGLDWETNDPAAASPAQEIIRYAKENDVDMIVIGTARALGGRAHDVRQHGGEGGAQSPLPGALGQARQPRQLREA